MWTLFLTISFFNLTGLVGGVGFEKNFSTEIKCQTALAQAKASESNVGWEWTDGATGTVLVAPTVPNGSAGHQTITGFCLSSSPKVMP